MTTTCEWIEYHDDMYPEFAPALIVITCSDPATQLVTCTVHDPDGDGPESEALCDAHTQMWMAHAFECPHTSGPYKVEALPEGYVPPVYEANGDGYVGQVIPLDEV